MFEVQRRDGVAARHVAMPPVSIQARVLRGRAAELRSSYDETISTGVPTLMRSKSHSASGTRIRMQP